MVRIPPCPQFRLDLAAPTRRAGDLVELVVDAAAGLGAGVSGASGAEEP